MQRISDEELSHHIAELDAEWEAFRERGENSPNIGEAFDNVARDLRDARAEVERMRPVVEAAEAWRRFPGWSVMPDSPMADSAYTPETRNLARSVDTYRQGSNDANK